MAFSSTHLDAIKHSTNGPLAGTTDICRKAANTCQQLIKKHGVHSTITMQAAGFYYTGVEDTACCDICGLEMSGWTLDMKPFTIHSQRSPACSFVLSVLPTEPAIVPLKLTHTSDFPTVNDEGGPFEHQETETIVENCHPYEFVEVQTLKQARKQTFSHWPYRISPSSTQMIKAGFFNCNVNDRVICLYCNLICEQWAPNTDDPWVVHKILSPKCPYVIAMLKRLQTPSLANANPSPWNQGAHHKEYVGSKMRHDSFDTWPNENFPSVDDLVRAGFFYTGTKTTVKCFYCNGSLTNWGPNDNPIMEHARWFPYCLYAKQLCGNEMYRKIQEHKRHQEEQKSYYECNIQLETNDIDSISKSMQPSVKNDLLPSVEACLDLPISRSLLAQNFNLSIIKRCWEDQLFYKHSEGVSDSALLVACMILDKQIKSDVAEQKNIIIPSEQMRKIRKKNQTGLVPLN